MAQRAAAALLAEVALGCGVLVAGLLALDASGPDSAAAPPALTDPAPAITAITTTTTTTTTTPATSTPTTGPTAPGGRRPATTTVTPATGPPIVTHRATVDVIAPQPVTTPVRLAIPALGVDGPVLPRGVNGENGLDVPPDARSLVWYRHGPAPGDLGSAVIAGHLNWDGERGLFADLADTPVGADVLVGYDDGSHRSFRVTAVELVPKPDVSVNGVFARDGTRVLRLVTCGGEFDEAVNSYRSNVVVTAVPA